MKITNLLLKGFLPLILIGCAAKGPPLKQNLSLSENKIYHTYTGTDLQAMAKLGNKLEAKRPSLSRELLFELIVFLKSQSEEPKPTLMVRSLMFRTIGVLVGDRGVPLLKNCSEEGSDLLSLCKLVVDDMEALKDD